ncbi:hypothetical protein PS687_03380 [Pseudomonas fluorescens]|nr:hypothetical protein PS687_03380 [Pseudomonas fluorescens]
MKIINAINDPDVPGMMLFQPAGVLQLPNSVEISDAQSVNGSGVGGGSNSIKTAIGEYFERRHFYREVVSNKRGCLGGSLRTHEVKSFAKAFFQTGCKSDCNPEIENYPFALSEVVRISDLSPCFIPTVCMSLSSYGLEQDSLFYPLRDTCGCSFHWCSEFAFLGAVKECLERQFLLRFWLTGKCQSRISDFQVRALLLKRNVRHLYNALTTSGDITFFDISDVRFPGVCLLVVYGQSKSGHHVKYCAGMSYSSALEVAVEKSLLELWQTYRFMDLFKSVDSDELKIEDYYLRYFMSCNAYETYQEISDIEVVGQGRRQGSSLAFTLSGFLSALNNQRISGYFYTRVEKLKGASCVFSKFVSPDLFLHMNNSKNCNIYNKFSKEFASSMLVSRMNRMVPFP